MALKDLFKKYGEKDYIKMKFDPERKRFDYYYGLELIPPRKLESNLRKQLEHKNNDLINDPNALNNELQKVEHEKKVIERVNKLKQMGYSIGSTSVVGNKKVTPIPNEFDNKLNRMLSEENVLYGIHRVGNLSDENIINILENGLDMTVLSYAYSDDNVNLGQNVGYYADNMEIKSELINAYGYKNSRGSLLIRIPDEDLVNHNYFKKENNECIKLKPEYIVGYVPIKNLPDGSVTIDNIVTLEDIRQIQQNQQVEEANNYYQENNYNVIYDEPTYEEENVGRSR